MKADAARLLAGDGDGSASDVGASRRSTPRALGLRVLVVDDDEGMRSALRDVLEVEGYQVDEAKDGVDALARLRRGPLPAVVVTDLVMPGGDGFTFLETMKREPTLADLPVLVMSGAGWELLSSAPVARGYLVKPFDPHELLWLLAHHAR